MTDSLTSEFPQSTLSELKHALRQQVLSRRDVIDPAARGMRSLQICKKLERVLVSHFATNNLIGSTRYTPTIGLYHAMRSEVNLADLDEAMHARAWNACYPLMLQPGEVLTFDTLTDSLSPDTSSPDKTSTAEPPSSFLPDTPSSKTVSSYNAMAFFAPPRASQESTHLSSCTALTTETAQEILAHPLRRHNVKELEAAGFHFVAPSAIDALIVPLVAFDDRNFRLGYGGGNYDNFLPHVRKDCLVIGVAFEEQHTDAVPIEPHDIPMPSIIVG